MTTPVSLVPGAALPAAAGTTAATAAPDDVFASVLAALSGAMGLPWPPVQPLVPEQATPAEGVVASTVLPTADAVPTAAVPTAVPAPEVTPAVWTAVTQRAPLAAPTPSVAAAPAAPVDRPTAESAPDHLPEVHHDVELSAPAEQTVPVAVQPQAVVLVPEVVPATAPARASAEAPVAPATSTHHVKPALVEAARGLRHEGGGRTSLVVRLDPPELGAVLVRLTVQDGRVDVTLRTPDLAARADLQAQSFEVEQVLRDQGFDLSSFDVAHGDVLSGDRQDASDRSTPERSRRADGHTADNPVTDDGPAPEPSGTWL